MAGIASGTAGLFRAISAAHPRVRIGKKRVLVPVLVTLGMCADGRRMVLDLRLTGVESEQAWLEAVRALCSLQSWCSYAGGTRWQSGTGSGA
jgi:transposase-like protein